MEVKDQQTVDAVLDPVVQVGRLRHLDDFASNQFVFDPIPVLVEFLGHRQELIGREEGSRRHRYYSSVGLKQHSLAAFALIKTPESHQGEKYKRCDAGVLSWLRHDTYAREGC